MIKYRVLLSNLALVALLAVGAGYLLVDVMRIDPTASSYTVTVQLAKSGGLLDASDATYRGSRIGQVGNIRLRPGGVAVDVRIDEGVRVPADSEVAVANLSAAGEQYLDFRPRTRNGPFLRQGSVVTEKDTRTPTPFANLMMHIRDLSKQIDPGKLDTVVSELADASGGTGPELRRIFDGGQFLLTGLEQVLPETVRTLKNGSITLNTAYDLRDQVTLLSKGGKTLGDQLRASDPEIRELLDDSPEALALVDSLIEEKRPTLAALLGDLGTVSEIVSVRTPAVAELLPGLAKLGDALSGVVRDGVMRTRADIWPRGTCDYGTPRHVPVEVRPGPPPLDRHCTKYGPTLQQRGAYNAPRPGN